MSRAEMARALGVSYWTLTEAERGYSNKGLPPAVLRALAAWGVDVDALAEEYLVWLQDEMNYWR